MQHDALGSCGTVTSENGICILTALYRSASLRLLPHKLSACCSNSAMSSHKGTEIACDPKTTEQLYVTADRALTFGLQLRPQVDRLMPGLVGIREVAGIPGWCAHRWYICPGEQETACGGLLCLQLSRDGCLGICLHQALNVSGIPARPQRVDQYPVPWKSVSRSSSRILAKGQAGKHGYTGMYLQKPSRARWHDYGQAPETRKFNMTLNSALISHPGILSSGSENGVDLLSPYVSLKGIPVLIIDMAATGCAGCTTKVHALPTQAFDLQVRTSALGKDGKSNVPRLGQSVLPAVEPAVVPGQSVPAAAFRGRIIQK